jgi:tetratricopeptide (TPR) repeat protein
MRYLCSILLILLVSVRCAFAQTDTDATSLVKEAVHFNNAQKYTDALDKFNQALKLEPDNIYANYGIAYSLLSLGRGDEGIPHLQKVIQQNSSLMVQAYDLLGSIYDKDKNSAKAIEAFNAGIKLDPTYQRSHYNLGLVYFRDKAYDQAEKCAIDAIKLDPKHASSQRMYALVCFHQNKRAEALLGLCSFILLEPNTARTTEAYGNIQHILQGGNLKAEPGTPLNMVSANDIALNVAIGQAVGQPDKKKYLAPADLLTAQLTAIFNTVGPMADKQTGNDFFKNYFANYFCKLAQSPNMAAFARMVSQNTPESAEWIKNNASAMTALDEWVKGAERGF